MITWIFPVEGQQLRYCGNGVGYDDVIIKGNPDDMKVSVLLKSSFDWLLMTKKCSLKFIAYYTKAGKVIAVAR
jgi:hypothetical protein